MNSGQKRRIECVVREFPCDIILILFIGFATNMCLTLKSVKWSGYPELNANSFAEKTITPDQIKFDS